MTQTERVLRHLRDVGAITSAEAMAEYGIHRLAARIADLKAQGVKIKTSMASGKNRFGETTHYAVYELEESGR